MRDTVTLANGSVYSYGCILDGSHGWRSSSALVRIAMAEGMAPTCHDQRALALFEGSRGENLNYPPFEVVAELMDEAGVYLNGLIPDDISAGFFWEDGEFFFCPLDGEGEPIWE